MLKRFYSKRSGFTLVEIVVAFAVFAIMASMIAQILDLAIRARSSNNLYALELARQEKLLSVIQKDQKYYNEADKTGTYAINLDGKSYEMGYQVKAVDPDAENQAEGINYFLGNVNYECPTDGGDDTLDPTPADIGGGTQMARMDTRITGTAGIGGITIYNVMKDEYAYPDDSPFKLPAGHTRYFFEISASSKNKAGTVTLKKEDVPYSQFRLFFYSDELDAAKSAVIYTDENDGSQYTKDVYKQANVVKVGHIATTLQLAKNNGLSTSNTKDGMSTNEQNPLTVQKLGTYSVRIGTPFVTLNGERGVRFEGSKFIRFYVEFEGDPHITAESFGHNQEKNDSGKPVYRACPIYEEAYNTDGTPKYSVADTGAVHPSIYGGYMYTKHTVTTG